MERLPTDDMTPDEKDAEGSDAAPPLVRAFRRHFGSMRGQVRLLEGDLTDPSGEDWGYDPS